jgi:hypothetical protein
MFNDSPAISYPKFKVVIIVLIALNVVIYAVVDTWTSAVDALVWLALLVMYELETNGIFLTIKNKLQRIRNFLIAVIATVFASYVLDNEWLDVVNSVLWFVLIALLELEVRWPDKVFRYRQSYWLATVAVFACLIGVVIAWLWRSAWLDVYDAILWIVAFAAIEVDIFQLLQRKQA